MAELILRLMVGPVEVGKCRDCGENCVLVRHVHAVNGLALESPQPTCSFCRAKEVAGMRQVDEPIFRIPRPTPGD